jgi:hypothetical protein
MKMKRINTVAASGMVSSYKKSKNPNERWDVSVFGETSYITPDMFIALLKLNDKVKENKGELYITELSRTWEMQDRARKEFLTGKKAAYVSPPGGSFHQAGRAVDFSVGELNFKDTTKEKWLKKFWDIAKPIGFYPIITIPDLGASEAWHFDYPGVDWANAYQDAGKSKHDTLDYTLIAKCAILDIGKWNSYVPEVIQLKMFIQAQLIRLGYYEIGEVDGIVGKNTKNALKKRELSFSSLIVCAQQLSRMAS